MRASAAADNKAVAVLGAAFQWLPVDQIPAAQHFSTVGQKAIRKIG